MLREGSDGKPLRSPYLENFVVSCGLPERQVRILKLMVLAENGRDKAAERAQGELEALLKEGVSEEERRAGPARETAATKFTLEALSEAGALTRSPRTLVTALWPRVTVTSLSSMTLEALAEWSRPERLGLRPFSAPMPEDLPLVRDAIRLAKMAPRRWPVGLRLLRASVWLVPEPGWAEGVEEEVRAFQQEVLDLAARCRPIKGRSRVHHVHLQVTPMSAVLAESAGVLEGGSLRILHDAATKEEEGAVPPSMLDPGQASASLSTFAFDDYRPYLRAWFERKQALRAPGRDPYTQGMLAQRVPCNSSLISKLLSGEGKLPEHHVAGMVKALRLSAPEAEDFSLLVRLTHATEPLARAMLLRDRLALPGFREGRPALAAAMAAFSSPTHLALFELARHPDFRPDPDWIADVLTTGDRAACAAALDDLSRLGALVPDASGVPRPATAHFSLSSDTRRELMLALHLSLLDHADAMVAQAPELTRRADQCIVLPVGAMEELTELVRALHRRVDTLLQAARDAFPNGPWTVRLFTLQLFPTSDPLPPNPASEPP